MGFGGNRSRLQITVQLDYSSLYGNFSGENIESFQMLSNPGCGLSVAVGGVTVSLLSIRRTRKLGFRGSQILGLEINRT